MHDATFAAIARYAFERNDLNKNEKAVLIALGSFVNASTREAWPSTRTLSDMTGLSPKAVQRAFRGLEANVLENEGQVRPDGSWSTNRYVLLVDLDIDSQAEGGQGDHLNTLATTIDSSKDSRTKSKGISVVRKTTPAEATGTPQPAGSSWIADLARELSGQLADLLIEKGLKNARYRGDAESDEWVYWMEAFVGGTISQVADRVGGPDWGLVREVYVEAICLSPDFLDFKTCSSDLVPPRYLNVRADSLLGVAARKVLPRPETFLEEAPLVDLEERRRNRERADALMKEIEARHEERKAERMRASGAGKGRSVRRAEGASRLRGAATTRSPQESQEDQGFMAEIDQIVGDGD